MFSEATAFYLSLLLLFVINGIALSTLFTIWRRHVETRKEVLPLCILTVLHILFFIGCWIFKAPGVMFLFYVCAIPAVLLFFLIEMIVLAISSRVTRHIGIAAMVFTVNIILHPFLVVFFFFLLYYKRNVFW